MIYVLSGGFLSTLFVSTMGVIIGAVRRLSRRNRRIAVVADANESVHQLDAATKDVNSIGE